MLRPWGLLLHSWGRRPLAHCVHYELNFIERYRCRAKHSSLPENGTTPKHSITPVRYAEKSKELRSKCRAGDTG